MLQFLLCFLRVYIPISNDDDCYFPVFSSLMLIEEMTCSKMLVVEGNDGESAVLVLKTACLYLVVHRLIWRKVS